MKTFQELRDSQHNEFYAPLYEEIRKYLEEKLLIIGKGKNTDQAVILAGGAGSGKSFAVNQMIGGQYKIFNPDDIKDTLVKMRDNISKGSTNIPKSGSLIDFMKKIKTLDLRNPNDTGLLHLAVKDLKVTDTNLYQRMKSYMKGSSAGFGLDQRRMFAFFMDPSKTVLPNVLFDATLKSVEQLLGDSEGFGLLDFLKAAGYKSENIHLVWILTDHKLALRQNLTRDRVVPANILFQTHSGAAKTMQDIMIKDYRKLGINGDISVIIGGKTTMVYRKNSKVEGPDGKIYKVNKEVESPIVKDFKYFRVKLAGENSINAAALTAIGDYIKKFAPKPKTTPQKELDKAIDVIGRRKKGKKIHATTAQALDIPLNSPAVDPKTIKPR